VLQRLPQGAEETRALLREEGAYHFEGPRWGKRGEGDGEMKREKRKKLGEERKRSEGLSRERKKSLSLSSLSSLSPSFDLLFINYTQRCT